MLQTQPEITWTRQGPTWCHLSLYVNRKRIPLMARWIAVCSLSAFVTLLLFQFLPNETWLSVKHFTHFGYEAYAILCLKTVHFYFRTLLNVEWSVWCYAREICWPRVFLKVQASERLPCLFRKWFCYEVHKNVLLGERVCLFIYTWWICVYVCHWSFYLRLMFKVL